MENQISDIERRILAVLQEGFPQSETPYKDMAEMVGIDTKRLLAVLENWKHEGKLRRIGSIVDHFKVGLSGGAMGLDLKRSPTHTSGKPQKTGHITYIQWSMEPTFRKLSRSSSV